MGKPMKSCAFYPERIKCRKKTSGNQLTHVYVEMTIGTVKRWFTDSFFLLS